MWTANPAAQSKIEPVSDLRLHKFGNIAETARRFSAEIWARREIWEPRDCGLARESAATARILAIRKRRTRRPDWVAGGAVDVEPVSVTTSLLTGNFTGNLAFS